MKDFKFLVQREEDFDLDQVVVIFFFMDKQTNEVLDCERKTYNLNLSQPMVNIQRAFEFDIRNFKAEIIEAWG